MIPTKSAMKTLSDDMEKRAARAKLDLILKHLESSLKTAKYHAEQFASEAAKAGYADTAGECQVYLADVLKNILEVQHRSGSIRSLQTAMDEWEQVGA